MTLAPLRRFFFTPASPVPLAVLRIGVSLTLLVQAFMIRSELLNLYSSEGYVQGALNSYLANPAQPQIAWIVPYFGQLGVSEATCIFAVCGAYVFGLALLGAGLFTRTAAIMSWVLHWTLMNTAETTNYGADLYGHVFLFYMMFAPVGAALSVDVALGRIAGGPSAAARFTMRVMQLHLCITYLASGIEKASGSQWWNGDLLFRAFQLPEYRQFDMSWLAQWPLLAQVAGWSTLVLETFYCVFIWPRRTRKIWVAAMCSMHIGIAIFLGLGVFGAIMTVLTLSLFGVSAEPRLATVPAREAVPCVA